MIDRDEALIRVRQWYGVDRGTEVGLHEFELGYVGWLIDPPQPESAPPSTAGVPRVVVDKRTGTTEGWPCLPVQLVAAQYAARRA
ncbi:MAG: hypothetical protein HKP61_01210 [Dactylosporangium sp.]|nr:hypothetical protein [Dactylosporangium sp.]NNJ59588.1 hypothetical protein [Dactylosporangium sp.]